MHLALPTLPSRYDFCNSSASVTVTVTITLHHYVLHSLIDGMVNSEQKLYG
jgi:hypothetical protein